MPEWVQHILQSHHLQQLAHFHLLRPAWLLALLPLFWSFHHLWREQSPMARWRGVIAPHLLKAMLVRHGRAGRFSPVSVGMVLVLLGIVALAGPTWKQQPSPFSKDIAPLVIMLDASSTMQQNDVQPSRLERAKQKVQDLLALRPGGLTGLVVYAGSAHSVIPLTNDADVVNHFLNAITTAMMPRQGKAPEKALPIVQQMLADSPVPGTVLMIGDGVGPNTDKAFSRFFSSQPHQLLLLAVGSENPSQTDEVVMPLERAALQKLAADSGGYYQALTLGKEDVRNLNRRIDNAMVLTEDSTRPWVDAGYYLLFPIALLMLLWFRKGWTLHWCLLLVCAASLLSPAPVMAAGSESLGDRFISLWLTPDQQGRYYMEKGEYEKAATKFENIAWRGIAYYRAQNFKAAAEMFSRIETADGYFNLANALAHDRHYVLAVKTYDKVLALEPGNASAKKNRDIIQKIIDEINAFSASQQAEDSVASKELGKDEPQTAQGAERKDIAQSKAEPITAEQLLLDEQLNELWMQQVQKDPSRFLGVKFHMQLQREEDHAVP